MSKSMLIAFIGASVAQATAKTGVERLQYIPCGVKDGVVFSHNGDEFGRIEGVEDCLWIPEAELKKSRIADANFLKYKQDMLKCLSVNEEEPEDTDESCDDELVEDINDAIKDGDFEDARAILADITNKRLHKKMEAVIADAEKGDADEDVDGELLDELKELIEDCDGIFTDEDIKDMNDIVADMSDKKLIKEAKKLIEEATAVDEEDDLTEEEAIEEIKLAIADGDKADAEELLKFIKTPNLARRYARKVKGL